MKWSSGASDDRLSANQVHVWRIALAESRLRRERLLDLLAADEWARADRLRFAKDRDRFIIARATLRRILGRILEREPQTLRFAYGPEGKPMLLSDSGAAALRFNLSHAGNWALCAVTRDREVGIDIERIKPDLAFAAIIDQFFTPGEARVIRNAPETDRKQLFFQYWVRKEALLKATGKGLSFPPNKVDVSRQTGDQWSSVALLEALPAGWNWYGRDLFPAPGYTAAIVVQNEPAVLWCRDYPGGAGNPAGRSTG